MFTGAPVEPRVGVTYAMGKDRQTLLRGTFSRYAEQLGQLPLATRVNPLGYSYAYFYFEDANSNLILDPGEVGSLQFAYTYNIDPANPASVITPNVNDRNLTPTLTDELTFGIDQGFGANLAVGLTATYRNIYDIPEARIFVVDDATGQTRLAARADWVQGGTVSGTLPTADRRQAVLLRTPYADGGTLYTTATEADTGGTLSSPAALQSLELPEPVTYNDGVEDRTIKEVRRSHRHDPDLRFRGIQRYFEKSAGNKTNISPAQGSFN